MQTAILGRVTDEVQISRKMRYFKKCVKIPFSKKFKYFVFFKDGKPGLLPNALQFDIKFHSKQLLSKRHIFALLINKNKA